MRATRDQAAWRRDAGGPERNAARVIIHADVQRPGCTLASPALRSGSRRGSSPPPRRRRASGCLPGPGSERPTSTGLSACGGRWLVRNQYFVNKLTGAGLLWCELAGSSARAGRRRDSLPACQPWHDLALFTCQSMHLPILSSCAASRASGCTGAWKLGGPPRRRQLLRSQGASRPACGALRAGASPGHLLPSSINPGRQVAASPAAAPLMPSFLRQSPCLHALKRVCRAPQLSDPQQAGSRT